MSEKKIRVNAVVNYIIDLANNINLEITNLKLQKLLFFVNGFYYCGYNKDLFNSKIEAWQYGPVVPEIYHEFKRFGNKPITTRSCIFEPAEMDDIFIPALNKEENLNEMEVVKATFNLLAGKSTGFLVELSHREDSPWCNIWNADIRDKTIYLKQEDKNYFNSLLKMLIKTNI